MPDSIADLRKDYTMAGLRRKDLNSDPIAQFKLWFDQALLAQVPEVNAMTLATVDRQGQPSSRIVLLKGVDERGFSFFTNYDSRKGRELAANPKAALTFFWPDLERQVCIRGSCSRLGVEESEAYFKIRPLGSRHSTWVSKQTEVISGRAWLEQELIDIQRKYPSEVPLPPYWGGFVLNPIALEFWQGRPSRLHDRFRYERNAGSWKVDRLSP
jgi:pyridoxamine 5'-phosphate oxidase